MFHKKFVASGDLNFARADFERFKAIVKDFTGLSVKVFDVVPDTYKTTFYYELVQYKPNHKPLSEALALLEQINESVKVGNPMSLRADIEKAIAYVKEAML